MTTPVMNTPRAQTHTVAFAMPPGSTIFTLPRPDDDAIELVPVPERRVAVVPYRGRYRGDVVAAQAQRLRDLVTSSGFEATGQPTLAGFDPPTTLPFLRRSEIWIELA
jgi:hypothetical protein